jgi:predicted ribosome quality control (RQC) complex YloA/Tae2 family protein
MADKSLNHLIAQTRQNISLLQELEQVSRQDAELILSKLPSVMDVSNAFRARAKYNYNEDGKVLPHSSNRSCF